MKVINQMASILAIMISLTNLASAQAEQEWQIDLIVRGTNSYLTDMIFLQRLDSIYGAADVKVTGFNQYEILAPAVLFSKSSPVTYPEGTGSWLDKYTDDGPLPGSNTVFIGSGVLNVLFSKSYVSFYVYPVDTPVANGLAVSANSVATAATPIPSSIWLFAGAIACAMGLRNSPCGKT